MFLWVLGEHEIFEVVEEPLPAYTFDVGGCIHVDCDICEVFVWMLLCLHRFSVSMLSYRSWAKRAKPLR